MVAPTRDGLRFFTFFRHFLRDPKTTGAIAPSSRALAREMLRGAGLRDGSTVVELGPGTGSFTREIVEAIGPAGRLIAIDRNEAFVRILRERFPRADFICGDARSVDGALRQRGVGPIDAVISGLPFANFDLEAQRSVLRAVRASLGPGGRFATFQYHHSWWLPSARRFRRILHRTFDGYRAQAVLWNLPPAFVLKSEKAIGSSSCSPPSP
ncbi:MAG: methyltransferase domain-containing protein [Planctomycetes bacterium]|nr:methyltransferase domain-containing protein [Planctomycetota bacterium]